MKPNIDSLLNFEKHVSDARRYRQKRIIRVVAKVFIVLFFATAAILLCALQKVLSAYQFYLAAMVIIGTGAISGGLEFIKIKIKGKQRSFIFEALQLLLIVIVILIFAQLFKTI